MARRSRARGYSPRRERILAIKAAAEHHATAQLVDEPAAVQALHSISTDPLELAEAGGELAARDDDTGRRAAALTVAAGADPATIDQYADARRASSTAWYGWIDQASRHSPDSVPTREHGHGSLDGGAEPTAPGRHLNQPPLTS